MTYFMDSNHCPRTPRSPGRGRPTPQEQGPLEGLAAGEPSRHTPGPVHSCHPEGLSLAQGCQSKGGIFFCQLPGLRASLQTKAGFPPRIPEVGGQDAGMSNLREMEARGRSLAPVQRGQKSGARHLEGERTRWRWAREGGRARAGAGKHLGWLRARRWGQTCLQFQGQGPL